mgnify:CR=1 FL=1
MIILTLENFEREILESEKPCIVSFKSDGCHLCLALTRMLFGLKKRYGNKFKFGVVDIGTAPEIFEVFDIDGVPTMFLFEAGDGIEIPYPRNPSPSTGYSEEYLTKYFEVFLNDE